MGVLNENYKNNNKYSIINFIIKIINTYINFIYITHLTSIGFLLFPTLTYYKL